MFLQIKSMPKLSPEPFIAQTSVYIMQLKLAHFPFKIGSLESSDATFVFLAAFFLVKMKGPPKREGISAHADGVLARETLCSAPHRHERKF